MVTVGKVIVSNFKTLADLFAECDAKELQQLIFLIFILNTPRNHTIPHTYTMLYKYGKRTRDFWRLFLHVYFGGNETIFHSCLLDIRSLLPSHIQRSLVA